MQKIAAIVLATSLLANTAYAATPLPPGQPAGVQQAQMWNARNLIWMGLGLGLIGGMAVLINSGKITPVAIPGGSPANNIAATTTTQ